MKLEQVNQLRAVEMTAFEHSLLLLDVLDRNKLHFLSFPEILESWRVTDAYLQFIREKRFPYTVRTGGNAPKEIEGMFQKQQDRWFEV